MSRKKNRDLVQLFIDALANLHEPNVMIESFAKYFDAQSAVFWRRNKFTTGEFNAKGRFNRPDLLDDENDYFLLSDENVIFRADQNNRTVVFGELGKHPFDKKWLKKSYTRYLSDIDINYIAVCPIEDREKMPFGAISLYFTKDIRDKKLVASELEHVGQFLHGLLKEVMEEVDAVITEQEKMGHEISGQVDSLNGTITNLQRFLMSRYGIEPDKVDYFLEAKRKTAAIRESAKHKELSAALRSQRKNAVYLDPREEINYATQPIIQNTSRRKVTLQSTKSNFDQVEVKISPAHFQNILTNFVTNAVKYSSRGGIIQPSMSLNEDTGRLKISMTSSGHGIPVDERDKIWNARYRGVHARKRGVPGFGFGLNIVAEICDAYGMRYGYEEDTSSRGVMQLSTFWVEFPAQNVRQTV